ncbi:enoyl-ACP reductase FabI [Limosilactobacillus equigenerosi]|uniref:Enoyl-[acyl-carrier-protein] reductase [NADH] n=1 Tax=Limosilactobacillus equigenerosi DSM 18793 = JCM 14505 TaxID=1423742 RepID=A0A0R1UTG8_9LACO|nr:enoyl-ACP reductase FabI [Limosilactobacillus equigenerosi]KRL94938.1 Enoyl-[acyl-carrier protein] reductase [Limosilactobacillus equigenerosi DSM 18793 = JCM 14505]
MNGLLTGKKIVVMGVANKRSIAWGCAQVMEQQGAEIIYTYNRDRTLKSLRKIIDDDNRLIQCDATDETSIEAAFATIFTRFGKVDGIVHSIAFANSEDLNGEIMSVTKDGYDLAQSTSAYSLIAVSRQGQKILQPKASIVAMSYMGATRAIPNYNVMGVAKAALEANVRYLARDMGKYGVRVNALSAGAIKTLAVSGVGGYKDLLAESQRRTVDGENVTQAEVGGACAFLMSDLSTGVTGDIIYVDKGVHLI